MNDTCQPGLSRDVAKSGPDAGTLSAVLEAAERLQRRLDSALVGVGLSISKFDALDQLISTDEPLTLGDLAGRLHCVRSNITQLIDRLEADGLVKRGSCSDDRRAVRAKVTPIGEERHAAGVTAIRAVQAAFAEKLGAGDRDRLVRLLSALEG
ncbi:MAG: MarR family transcriptional regulator [bacterium]